MDFFKYQDSPQVYNSQNQAVDYNTYLSQGGAKDFGNVQTLSGQQTPTLLQQQPTRQITTPAAYSSANAANKVQDITTSLQGIDQNLQRQKQQQLQTPPDTFSSTIQDKVTELSKPQPAQTAQDVTGTDFGQFQKTQKEITGLLNQSLADTMSRYADYNTQVNQLKSGSYPISPEQQAMIDSIQASVQRQAAAQEKANKAMIANVTMSGIRRGATRYTSDTQDNEVFTYQSDALQKVTDIQNQGLALIAQTKQAFTDKNWQMLNDSFNQFQQNQQNVQSSYKQLLAANADAEKLANDRLKAIQDERNAQRDDQLNALKAQWEQQQDVIKNKQAGFKTQQEQSKFVLENGIAQPAYKIGNQLYNTATGQPISSLEEAQALGLKEDLSNVQEVKPQKKYSPGVIGEYERYLEDVQKGVSPMKTFDQYSTIDANRKAVRVTNNTTNVSKPAGYDPKEFTKVQNIIKAHPGNGAAATQAIKNALGQEVVDRYGDLIKQEYALPTAARTALEDLKITTGASSATTAVSALTPPQWQAARASFIKENNYVDPDTAAAVFEKTIPQPNKVSGREGE